MLRTWQLRRATLARPARSRAFALKLSSSSAPGQEADGRSDGVSCDDAAQDEASLRAEPVPDFIGAIFTRRPYPRPWHYDHLLSPSEASQLANLNWADQTSPLRKFTDREVIHYNEMLARSKQLGQESSLIQILHGLRIAIHRPETMKTYLDLRTLPQKNTQEAAAHSTITHQLRIILDALDTINFEALKQKDLTKVKQYFVVLGGRIRSQETGKYDARESSIYHLVRAYVPQYWQRYLQLVHAIGGPEAIYDEWRSFIVGDGDANDGFGSTQWLAQQKNWRYTYWNVVIRLLAGEESWRLAWQVLRELPVREQQFVEKETWVKLLAYPQGLKEWQPKLAEPAIEMLQVEIDKLEKQLGITWRGGEDGYHVLDGQPFWADQEGLD